MSKASSKPSKKRFASSSFFSFLSDSKAHKNTRGVLRCAQVCFVADLLACSLPCGQMDKVDKVFHREEFSCSVEFNKVCSTTGPRIHPPPPLHTHTHTHAHAHTNAHTHACLQLQKKCWNGTTVWASDMKALKRRITSLVGQFFFPFPHVMHSLSVTCTHEKKKQ